MTSAPIFIDQAAIAAALPPLRLAQALEAMFAVGAEVPSRLHYAVPTPGGGANDLLLMPAWRVGGKIGVKLVTVRGEAGPGPTVQAIYVVADAITGAFEAVLDGRELTNRRTAATSALAARRLARPDARRLLVVGAGALAPYLAEAHTVCRGLRSVAVWARRPRQAHALAAALAPRLRAEVTVVEDLEQAVGEADIITCATTTLAPIILGAWLREGQHLDLVGGYTPAMREVDDAAIQRARVFVDDRVAALSEAGDLIQPLRAGAIGENHILGDLAGLVRGECPGRTDARDITLFKSVGLGSEDLAAAMLLLEGRG